MKKVRLLLIVLLVLIFVVSIGSYSYLRSFTPNYDGDLQLPGLGEEVTVKYDRYGIPHIYAQNESDAYRALGYVQAKDRLFQMEILRRVTRGELSEILGRDLLEVDILFRTLGIHRQSAISVEAYFSGESQTPWQRSADAYLDGVNAYVRSGETPLEFKILGMPKREFRRENLYDVMGYMSFGFGIGMRADPVLEELYQQLGPEYLADFVMGYHPDETHIPNFKPGYFPDDETASQISPAALSSRIAAALEKLPVAPLVGSNSWVLGPDRTESGKVILENDPHIGFSQPAVWYEAHLETPGWHLYGNHLAGFPFAPIGNTRDYAVGLTMFENDDIHYYREQRNPGNPDELRFKEEWIPLQLVEEVIHIKGEADTTIIVEISRHGPIMDGLMNVKSQDVAHPVALWWEFLQRPSRVMEAAWLIGHADSMQDVAAAAALINSPGLNIMYGDASGNIAWWATAQLYEWPADAQLWRYLDGASGEDEPIRALAFHENPQSVNPPSGYVYSANNPHEMASGGEHQAFYYPGYYAPRNRAARIVELLDARERWDAKSVREMTLDDRSGVHLAMLHEILNTLDPKTLSDREVRILEIARNWEGDHDPKLTGPVIYWMLRYQVLRLAMLDELGEEQFKSLIDLFPLKRSLPVLLAMAESPWWDDRTTEDEVESREEIFANAFSETVSQLTTQLGEDISTWTWGRVHSVEHVHLIGRRKPMDRLFNVGPFAVGGAGEVLNNLDSPLNGDGLYLVNKGPSQRMVIDFSQAEMSWGILPTGNSGRAMSPHYGDQAEMYNRGDFRYRLLDRDEIEKQKTATLTLRP